MDNLEELEGMKLQIAELKSRLDDQEIINEKVMRKAMRDKVSWMKRQYYIMMIVAVVGIPYTFWAFSWIGMSIEFSVITVLFFCVAAIYTYYSQNAAINSNLMEESLIEVSHKMIRMKKLNARWLWFGVPFIICWLGWFVYEIGGMANAKPMLIGGLVGGVIGAIIGIHNYCKYRKKINEVLSQIKELTESK